MSGEREPLLPCPFDGHRAQFVYAVAGDPGCYVSCLQCMASGPSAHRDVEAAILWNRRAALSPPVRDPLVGELVEALRPFAALAKAMGAEEGQDGAPFARRNDTRVLTCNTVSVTVGDLRCALNAFALASTPDSSLQEGAGPDV